MARMRLTILLVFSYFHLASSSPDSGARKFNSRNSIECPSQDDAGSSLASSSDSQNRSFFTCTYEEAGVCTYFSDGSFSSGASSCPSIPLVTTIPGAQGCVRCLADVYSIRSVLDHYDEHLYAHGVAGYIIVLG
ncbi:hypothetical protein C8J56DRAFT_4702 [Mycena floridula]|nr:hypothetical protein C8J56DRAFT_4702 [Mycena floridula]